MNEQVISGSGRKRQEVIVSGGSLAIDTTGLATSAKQDTQTTELTSIKTAVETIDNAIAGTEMQVDVVTAPAIATGDNTIGRVKVTDGTTVATVRELGTNDALNVAITDGSGNQVTSFGGGTQYTEGDTDASITGTALMMEGAADTLVVAPGTTADGLLVNLGSNNDVIQSTHDNLNANANVQQGNTDVGAANPLQVSLANTGANATPVVVDLGANNDVTVTGTLTSAGNVTNAGTFVVQENGAALTALQLIDDPIATDDTTAHATGTTKVMGIGAVATPTDASVNANDIGMPAMTLDRKLHVAVMDALPAGTAAIGKLAANSGVDIGDVDVTSIIAGTGATNLGKAEDAGHTTGDTGVYILGVRNDTPNTALTNTDADYGSISLYRTGAVRTAIPEEDFAALGSNHVKKYYTSAGAVTDGIVWSPAAGKRWYITSIFINVSAAATVTLEDDLAGGDSPIWKAELAANSGWSSTFPVPWFSGEDAADLLITTTAGNVYVTVVGYEI